MGKSRFIELMAKSIGKSATKEELEELDNFLEQFPEYKKMQNVTGSLKGSLKQPGSLVKERDLNTGLEELWNKIKKTDAAEGTDHQKNIIRAFIYWKWAAAAIVLITLSGVFFYVHQWRSKDSFLNVKLHRIVVPYGKIKEVLLADGTKVKLNAGSTFLYPEIFSGTSRQVSLKGEGFFEVTKNPKKPFMVLTSNLTIKVLGTVFNVKAYPDEAQTEATLLKGRVQVELNAQPEKNIILLPNEKIIVTNNLSEVKNIADGKSTATKIEYKIKKLPNIVLDDNTETAWLNNRIVFTNENFDEVAKQMERKYNVQMIFEDQALKHEQLSGALENESLENALLIIKMTAPFKFRREGRLIYIAHK